MENSGDPKPFYRIHVFCCTNQRPAGHPRGSCGASGAEVMRGYLKARAKELGIPSIRVNSAGCLDRCELGPVMVIYPEGVWYAYHSYEDIDEILSTHLIKGGRVERLMLRPEDGPIQKIAP